jgi:peptidoglycan/LPS O-acetylase OafA/YrhL
LILRIGVCIAPKWAVVSNTGANLNNLDVLRAVAVLCVIVAHVPRHVFGFEGACGATLDVLGRFGVLVFFVHTSLVLMMSLDRSKASRLALDFYIRRAFRIYPLGVFVILLVVAARVPFMPDHQYEFPGVNRIIQNLLLVQNLTGAGSIIGPLWTLPYEIQMYTALPLLHIALRQRTPMAAFVVWLLAILARMVPPIIGWNPMAIHFVPCFLGGVFAHRARESYRPALPSYGWPVALTSVFALYAWLHGSGENPFLDYAMCLVLGASLASFKDMRTSRFTEICGFIAKYSYGSYLFHAPIMWVSFFVLAPFVSKPLQWAIFAGLSLAVPWVAYRLIEEPMIALGRRVAARVSQPEQALKSAAA